MEERRQGQNSMRWSGWQQAVAVTGLLLAGISAGAQVRVEPTGVVAGRVLCGDTNDPARMAKVYLEAVKLPTGEKSAEKKEVHGEAGSTTVERVTIETDLNGEFAFPKVAPGDYYVIVAMTGYLSTRTMFTEKEMADPSPEMRKMVARALNQVHVEAGHAERVEVRMERGAAVSGTVSFDDGSPANGVTVKLLKKGADGKWEEMKLASRMAFWGAATDDRGQFRISGLPPQTYMLEADLALQEEKLTSTGGGGPGKISQMAMVRDRFTLPFYSGSGGSGTARRSDAATFTVGPGQERSGEDLTIPLTKLHRVTGMVVAKRDGHKVDAAKVVLTYRDDGKELATAEVGREDGVFRFEFVPEGDYVVKTADARDVVWETVKNPPGMFPATTEKERLTTAYGAAEQPLLLRGEMSDVVLTVPDKAASKAGAAGAAASVEETGR